MADDGAHVDGTTHTRRVRVRAAHRGTVTRLINQLDEVLSLADVSRLKQMRQSLMAKMEILSRMDEEILALVEEDQVGGEIEQADVVREGAELAIISIDEALAALPKKSKLKKKSCNKESLLSSSSSDEENLRSSQATNLDEPETNASTCLPGATTESHEGSSLSVAATPFSPTMRMHPYSSIPTLQESPPDVTSSEHLPMSDQGPPLCMDHGEPMSSVCTTYIKNVHDSGIMTLVPNLKPPTDATIS